MDSDAADAPAPDNYPAGALPVGTRLGEFEVRSVLGVGGFGIVYHAFDHQLEREVAVKEYMPATLAGRTETLHVSLLSQSNADTFALGLRSFINEARLLARFDHPSLVKVYRFWEENSTAYMTMPLYRGKTLKSVRMAMDGPPDEAWLRTVLEPVLGAIDRLHQEGVYHRDIAPDNILLEADGHPVLLDFGAARRVISDKTQDLTAILKPSYAPIEQYGEAGSVKQGPWTDLYALGATMHFLLLGRPPLPAPARMVEDESRPLATMPLPGCSPALLGLIDWMLAPRPVARPQSVAEVKRVLMGESAPPTPASPSPQTLEHWERTQILEPGDTKSLITPRPTSPVAEQTVFEPRTVPAPPTIPPASAADAETTRPRALLTPAPVVSAAIEASAAASPPPATRPVEDSAIIAPTPRRSWGPALAAGALVVAGGAWFAFKPSAPVSPAQQVQPPVAASVATPVVPTASAAAPAPALASSSSIGNVTAGASTAPAASAPAPRVASGSMTEAGTVKLPSSRQPASGSRPSQTAAARPPSKGAEPSSAAADRTRHESRR